MQIIATDEFTGFKTTAADPVPDAVTVMAPFHAVALAGDKLNSTPQHVQRELTGGPGRRDDPLYRAHCTLKTGHVLHTQRQQNRLDRLLGTHDLIAVEVTRLVHHDTVDAYHADDRKPGKHLPPR